jgi:hypothetical protein
LVTDSNDIEELVEVAAQENSDAARRRLFRAIRRTEVFFPCDLDENDRTVVRSTPLARLADGSHAMMLFTSKSHPHLAEHRNFAGGTFTGALASALKILPLDWVILSNRAWRQVAINKQQIAAILDDLNSDTQTPNGTSEGETIEDLITEFVRSKSDQIAHRIRVALQERELFLELGAGRGQGGQPTLKTFRVEHLSHVVRVYTSRVRSGISYGGIRWPDLKDMVGAAPEIGGVQVMNNADDWIVFDRETLAERADADQ